MKLYLVRHGETQQNADKILQGQSVDPHLNENGLRQSVRAAEKLAGKRIDAAYTSNLLRAVQTTNVLMGNHSEKLKPVFTSDLREQNFGVFEGKDLTSFLQTIEDSGLPPYAFKPEGGESIEEVQRRLVRFYNSIKEKHVHESVLIVSHGIALSALQLYLLNKPLKSFKEYLLKNDDVILFEINDSCNRLEL